MARWKSFGGWSEKRHDYVYLLKIPYYPDAEVCTYSEARRTKEQMKKLGIKIRIKRIKNGRCIQTRSARKHRIVTMLSPY